MCHAEQMKTKLEATNFILNGAVFEDCQMNPKSWQALQNRVEQVQTDARIAGMKEAKRMCEQVYHASKYESDVQITDESWATNKAVEACQHAIESAAEQLRKGIINEIKTTSRR